METILNILSQPVSKEMMLWVGLVENIVILAWFWRKNIKAPSLTSLFKEKQN
jgi:hypothetical protein